MTPNGLSRENDASCCGWSQLRLPPSTRPPRRSFTGTRLSSPAASRGPAKRTSTPPSSTQRVKLVARIAGDVADVGEDHHRHMLIDELRNRVADRAALGQPHIGERRQRARQIVVGGEQRLRDVGGRAAHDADGAAAPALVEQLHRAGRAFRHDFEPRDVVADFDRQIELRLGSKLRRS